MGARPNSKTNVRHAGSTCDDAANTVVASAFSLFDAAIYYDNGPWRLALNGGNLANEKYLTTCAYRGAERSLTLAARYRW